MGACSIPEVRSVRVDAHSGESSDECCYIEVDPSDGPKTPSFKTCPPQSPAKNEQGATVSNNEGKKKLHHRCVVV